MFEEQSRRAYLPVEKRRASGQRAACSTVIFNRLLRPSPEEALVRSAQNDSVWGCARPRSRAFGIVYKISPRRLY